MANLPPRPESPLRMSAREDRRHAPDERDRLGDRRSAQPMAPRYRNERPPRSPERAARSYTPRSRPDTYIASRDGDRREYDDRNRDRDRNRDFGRDRRYWERSRERDRDRSPRRRSPDRDYHSSYRGPPRRPLSPPRRSGRPYRRDSRSPPPRRRYSRSPPPYRARHRSRSRTRSPYPSSPSRRIRLGNHSLGGSPRSRSPYKRRSSRDRSPSPSKRPTERKGSPSKDRSGTEQQLSTGGEPKTDNVVPKEEAMDTSPLERPIISVKTEDQTEHVLSPSPQTIATNEGIKLPVSNERESPIVPSSQLKEPSELKLEMKPEIKIERPENLTSPSIEKTKLEEAMDVVEESPNVTSAHTQQSASPKSSPVVNDYNRAPPTGPQRGWAPRSPPKGPAARSPPRGPRSHMRPPPGQPAASTHQFPPRGPRRGGFQSQGTPSSSYSPTVISHLKPPRLPRYDPKQHESPQFLDLEAEVSKLQNTKFHVTAHQHARALQKALQELDMATLDLQAAENRRIIADQQLEKAKIGMLGIDALPVESVP